MIKKDIDLDFTLKKLKEYLSISSPCGYTKTASLNLKNDFESFGLKTSFTKKGALIATLEGENTKEEVAISAHIDTLGGMIKEINPDGTLRFHKIGGGVYNSLEGENCTIISKHNILYRGSVVPKKRSIHVYGIEGLSVPRDEFSMIIRLDEEVSCKQDILALGISVGDFVAMDTRFETTKNGFIKSRYLDNKSSVAIVLEVCRLLNKLHLRPKYTTHFIISNFEEQGHGLSYIPPKTKELLAMDIGPIGEGQTSNEHSVTIAAKDKKTVYDYDFRCKLEDICKKHNINYVVDVFNNYSSDASQAILRGLDISFACIGPGVDATHHYERTHKDSIENTILLILFYLIND